MPEKARTSGDLDYYFKLRRGDVALREYPLLSEPPQDSDRCNPIQTYGDRAVYVPKGMSAAEIVEGALVLEREFDIGHYTASVMVEKVLEAVNRLRQGNGPPETPPGQCSAQISEPQSHAAPATSSST